jgi:hypothetical protein
MVYMPYPRTDLDNHADLISWRAKATKAEGDWKLLKEFLADSARLVPGKHPLSKCWYSELPQGDDFARDVEHFRPKNQAAPLTNKQIKEVEKAAGIVYEQDANPGSYPWLEFDYRNYRIVTAKTNRGGAKHIYFPLAKQTVRLTAGQLPWVQPEYPYFLDPANKHDASLLFVKPNGAIAPIAPKTALTQADFDNLPASWHNDGFNYLRAMVTIKLYRLDDIVFQKGRKEVYDHITYLLNSFAVLINENPGIDIKPLTSLIIDAILPSAPFSLAARSALVAYMPPPGIGATAAAEIKTIIKQIQNRVQQEIDALTIDWHKP